MSETTARGAHLAAIADARTLERDRRIAGRLAELVQRGVDPAGDGTSVASVLVQGGVVSRATFYRHKTKWTWEYLLDELLPTHQPRAAVQLAQLRNTDAAERLPDSVEAFAHIAPLLASLTPESDEQDLHVALEGILVAIEVDPTNSTTTTGLWDVDPWLRMRLVAENLIARRGVCRAEGEEDWVGAAAVLPMVYQVASRPDVHNRESLVSTLESLHADWIYCLVRSGDSPSQAMRTVTDAHQIVAPLCEVLQAQLWVKAGQALLDRRGKELRWESGAREESRSRNETVLREVLACAQKSTSVMSQDGQRYSFHEVGFASELLLTALHWNWTRSSPHVKSLAEVVVKGTRNGEELQYGNRTSDFTAFAWATWTLINSPKHSQDVTRAARVLVDFALRISRLVGKEYGGLLFDLRLIPPVVPQHLHQAVQECADTPGLVDAVVDLVERVTAAKETPSWSRLPRVQREAWTNFVRETPASIRPQKASPSIQRMTKELDEVESTLRAGAKIELDDVLALLHSAERVARLTFWASDAEWSSFVDTGPHFDVGKPFTRPPVNPPVRAEALGRRVRKSVEGAVAANLRSDRDTVTAFEKNAEG